MSKYKALFIEESREHLSELGRLLVALELSREPAPLIDDIFRHAHSIKGMAASMGYDPIVTLAHRVEDVVGARRASGAAFGRELVDLLLRGVDALSSQVESVASDAQIEAYAELVGQLVEASSPEPTPPKRGRKKSAPKGSKKASSRKASRTTRSDDSKTESEAAPGSEPPRGTRTVSVTLDESCKTPGVRLFLVHKKLAELTAIVGCVPSLDEMKGGQVEGHGAQFTVGPGQDDDALRNALLGVGEVETVEISAAGQAAETPAPRTLESAPEAAVSSATVRVRTDTLDSLIDNVGELYILRERLESLLAQGADPELRTTLDSLSAQIREVHSQVLTVRMTPMRTLTDRYPRMVRDLAHSLGKRVELEIEGAEIELDRAVLDGLDAPLVHTLRNAVDHGIESAAERKKSDKPEAGSIRIVASRDRDTVVVVIEDDGRGLNAESLRQRAVDLGLMTAAQAEVLSARDCYFLICAPGFSTKGEVTGVSGRGVGMDAVRAKIESFGGSLDIESDQGRLARFIFRLPLTVAIINALLVDAGRRLFAIPVSKVVAVRDAAEDTIQEAGGRSYLSFQHALAPVYPLRELLRLPGDARPEHIVVIEDGRDLIAVSVDRVVGYHEVVVKPLGDPLDRMELFAGATILGDGEPILILDLPKAVRMRAAA
jgi:two-component system chemotaxis sensor kinase CheA